MGGGGKSDKVVIDVGANVGDSALFFANKGYNVIGFEPVHSFYEVALKNIKLNPNLEKRIKLINKGVSDKKETIHINYNFVGDGGASSFGESLYECEVETLTIKDILNEFNIKNPYLLKMDCEGCENPIICNCDLSMFDKIIFEYHTILTGLCHEKLVDRLEKQGFKISKIEGNKEIGVIHLDKEDNLI
ncbi:methyltransferase domain protein [Methanobrevibacter cuticularis]|uniref:Methyltransferase domain protein n=1 Tax=Methanobrevibacter cuticularis TaxID=47311 RepID=A0A166DW62_9EURY|nr:FkbM family methyltransferase [Methanobrevibacter cuticularis]KZX16015.1 methyltransferase domain protein [Methanobrevibacter cuticularis]